MIGSFLVFSGSSYWFKLSGPILSDILPALIIENLSDTDITYEVESAPTKGGALTALMTPAAVKGRGAHKTEVPKLAAGLSPQNFLWQKITITGAVSGLKAKISLHGINCNLSGDVDKEI